MPDKGLYILSGPVQSGKTTSLVQWVQERNDVYGILTPVVNGTRVFMNVHTGEQFRMEADSDEAPVIKVGRFVFSQAGFDQAIRVLQHAALQNGWVIIDETGPLELRGEGFHAVIKEVLTLRQDKVILVVRKGLEQQVQDYFAMEAAVLNNINEL